MRRILFFGMVMLLCIICNLVSCRQKTKEEKLVDYINDTTNHIIQKQIVHGVEMTVKYMPADYHKIIGTNGEQDYHENISLDIKISKPEVKKDKATTLYLDFDIQNDFQLAVNNSFLIPGICQKVENGIKDNYEYIVVFESPLLENLNAQQAELIYTDKIFGIGQRKFIFKKKDILSIPKLTSSL